jgi:hypothetical protein
VQAELDVLNSALVSEQSRIKSFEKEVEILESSYQAFSKALADAYIEGAEDLRADDKTLLKKATKLYRDLKESLSKVVEGVGAIKSGRKVIIEPRKLKIVQDFAKMGDISRDLENMVAREYLTSRGIPIHIVSKVLPQSGALGVLNEAKEKAKNLTRKIKVSEGVELTRGEILEIIEHVLSSGNYIFTADKYPKRYGMFSELDRLVNNDEGLAKAFILSQKLVRHHLYEMNIGTSIAKIDMEDIGLTDIGNVGLTEEMLDAEFSRNPKKVQAFISEARLDTIKAKYKALLSSGEITNELYQAVMNAANLLDANRFLSPDDVSYFCRKILQNQYNEVELAETVRTIRAKIDSKREEFESDIEQANRLIEKATKAKIRVQALKKKLEAKGLTADQVRGIIADLVAKIEGTEVKAESKARVSKAKVEAVNLAKKIEDVRIDADRERAQKEQAQLRARWEGLFEKARNAGVSMKGVKRNPAVIVLNQVCRIEEEIEQAENLAFFNSTRKNPTKADLAKVQKLKKDAEVALLKGDEYTYATLIGQAFELTGDPDFYINPQSSGKAGRVFYELTFDSLAKQAIKLGMYPNMKALKADYPQGANTELSHFGARLDERIKNRLKVSGKVREAVAEKQLASDRLMSACASSSEFHTLNIVAEKQPKLALKLADLLSMRDRLDTGRLERVVSDSATYISEAKDTIKRTQKQIKELNTLLKDPNVSDKESLSKRLETLKDTLGSEKARVASLESDAQKAKAKIKGVKAVKGVDALKAVASAINLPVGNAKNEGVLREVVLSRIEGMVGEIKSQVTHSEAETELLSKPAITTKAKAVGADVSAFDLNSQSGRLQANRYINKLYKAPEKSALEYLAKSESIDISGFDLSTYIGRYEAYTHLKQTRVNRATGSDLESSSLPSADERARLDRLEKARLEAISERAKARKERSTRLERAKERIKTVKQRREEVSTPAPVEGSLTLQEMRGDKANLDMRGRSVDGILVRELKALAVKYGLDDLKITKASKEDARQKILTEINKKIKAEAPKTTKPKPKTTKSKPEPKTTKSKAKTTKVKPEPKPEPKTTKSKAKTTKVKPEPKTTKPESSKDLKKELGSLNKDFSALSDQNISVENLKALSKKYGQTYQTKKKKEENRRALKRAVKKLLTSKTAEASEALVEKATKPKTTKAKATKPKATKSKTTKSKTTKAKTTKAKATKAKTTKSEPTKSKAKATKSEPTKSKAKTTKAKATKPKTTKPKTTKPKTTKPKTTKPKTTKAKTKKVNKKASEQLQTLADLSVRYPALRGDIATYLAHKI